MASQNVQKMSTLSLYLEARIRIRIRKRIEVIGMDTDPDTDPDPQHWLQTRRASSKTDSQLLSENVNPRCI